jgi:hypothetical protein
VGYFVDVADVSIRIAPENCEKAVSLFVALMEKASDVGSGGSWREGKVVERFYSWVTTSHVLESLKNPEQSLPANIADAFSHWGYAFSADVKDGVVFQYRERDKWGDDESLWEALAPCFDSGSFIEFRGEEGALWKYEFNGNSLRELTGHIEWR